MNRNQINIEEFMNLIKQYFDDSEINIIMEVG